MERYSGSGKMRFSACDEREFSAKLSIDGANVSGGFYRQQNQSGSSFPGHDVVGTLGAVNSQEVMELASKVPVGSLGIIRYVVQKMKTEYENEEFCAGFWGAGGAGVQGLEFRDGEIAVPHEYREHVITMTLIKDSPFVEKPK